MGVGNCPGLASLLRCAAGLPSCPAILFGRPAILLGSGTGLLGSGTGLLGSGTGLVSRALISRGRAGAACRVSADRFKGAAAPHARIGDGPGQQDGLARTPEAARRNCLRSGGAPRHSPGQRPGLGFLSLACQRSLDCRRQRASGRAAGRASGRLEGVPWSGGGRRPAGVIGIARTRTAAASAAGASTARARTATSTAGARPPTGSPESVAQRRRARRQIPSLLSHPDPHEPSKRTNPARRIQRSTRWPLDSAEYENDAPSEDSVARRHRQDQDDLRHPAACLRPVTGGAVVSSPCCGPCGGSGTRSLRWRRNPVPAVAAEPGPCGGSGVGSEAPLPPWSTGSPRLTCRGEPANGQCRTGLPSGSALPPVATDSEPKNKYTPTAANNSTT